MIALPWRAPFMAPQRLYARACLGVWRERLIVLDAERYDEYTPYANL